MLSVDPSSPSFKDETETMDYGQFRMISRDNIFNEMRLKDETGPNPLH